MADRSITHFSVGNGNCCLVQLEASNLAFDLKGTAYKSSWDLLSPFLRVEGGVRFLDVLSISHGDQDHCQGFTEWKEELDAQRLVIGTIWHPNFDRTKIEDESDLPADYLALHEEIVRRRQVRNPEYGDLEVPLTAWDTELQAFKGLTVPYQFCLKVLSPYFKDDETGEFDINDLSLVMNIEISGLSTLFNGDSGCRIWQDRIFPFTLRHPEREDWARAAISVASHHGSYTFFGENRDEVCDADPYPENYEALNYTHFESLIISASDRFPTTRDSSGDSPPHYAAWKWYHNWVQDNRNVDPVDKHPDRFRYTADGPIRLEFDGDWHWIEDWSPDDGGPGGRGDSSGPGGEDVDKATVGFVHRRGKTKRGPGHYA